MKLSLEMSKQKVCDEKYLRCGVHKINGKIVVGVGRIVVYPELPGDGGEDRSGEQHAEDDEGLLHEGEEVGKQGEKGEEEADIADTGV